MSLVSFRAHLNIRVPCHIVAANQQILVNVDVKV